MNDIMMFQAMTVGLGLSHVAAWLFHRNQRARLVAAQIEHAEKISKEAEEAFVTGTRLVAEECAALKIEVERAREVAGSERATRERYFLQVTEFERQRTQWQESYFAQSVGHGNAQELMMTTIENLDRQIRSLGHRPKIPSVLHALRSEYQSTHEIPAREAMAAIEAAKAAAQKPQPSTEAQPVEV